jgi:hypothetical protein
MCLLAGTKVLAAQESWEIFARELLFRFELFFRFSYGLQQYTRAKKRTAVYREP